MTKNIDPNHHIIEYLKYYCGLKREPGYAVMINGKWGSGKTWLVKEFIRTYKETIFISLNGVESYEEIESLIFQKIHPIWASKMMVNSGKLFKGLLKASIKYEFDDDNKNSININIDPTVNIPTKSKKAKNYILIFDDLERCKINVPSILGYINYFVEQEGQKVIIIANESEIDDGYDKIKEKLVGITFDVQPYFEDAIKSILFTIENNETKIFYDENVDLIKKLFFSSRYYNLRTLKFILWDFEKLYSILPDKVKKHEVCISKLFQLFYVLSIEIKCGDLQIEDINQFYIEFYQTFGSTDKKESDNPYKIIFKKYDFVDFNNLILDQEIWKNIFITNSNNKDEIIENINTCFYFRNDYEPGWLKLRKYRYLKESDFDELTKNVMDDIDDNKFQELDEFKHIIGIFLYFNNIDVYTFNKKEFISKCESNLDSIISKMSNADELRLYAKNDRHGGIAYMGCNLQEFKEIEKYINGKINTQIEILYPKKAVDLLSIIKEEPEKLDAIFDPFNKNDMYNSLPILSYLKPEDFVDTLLNICPGSWKHVAEIFRERYSYPDFKTRMKRELNWLLEVQRFMNIKLHQSTHKLTTYRLKEFLEQVIDTAINNLSNNTNESNLNE